MWKLMNNNLVINDKDKLYIHRIHLEKLLNAKSYIQNKGPDIPFFLKYNISNNELRRYKDRKRCYENAVIFSRLLDINNSISDYSKTYRPSYCAAFDKKKYDFDKTERIRNISRENISLYSRLIKEKTHYPIKKFLNSSNYAIHLKDIIKRQRSDNPNINFASFSQFKKNIIRDKKMNRSNSARMLRSSYIKKINKNLNESSDMNIINNYSYKRINSKKNNINNAITNGLIKNKLLGKNNLNRCQSALYEKKQLYNNKYF